MRTASKILVVILISALALEGSLRLFWRVLPPNLLPPISNVIQGEGFVAGSVEHFMANDRHHYVLVPGIENGTLQVSADVRVDFSTRNLWDQGVGVRDTLPSGPVDVMAVGDSFTFCMVATTDCWVSRLESEYDVTALNLGQPGTASISHAAMIEQYSAFTQPDLVVWQWFGNDFFEDYSFALVRGDFDRPSYTAILEDKEGVNAVESRRLDPLRDHWLTFAVFDYLLGNPLYYYDDYQRLFTPTTTVMIGDTPLGFGQVYEQKAFDVSVDNMQIGMPYTNESLAAARDFVADWGGELVVVLIPTKELVYTDQIADALDPAVIEIHANNYNAMLDICAEIGIPCLDPLPHFRELGADGAVLYYADDLHLNAAGNAALANLLANWLAENGIHLGSATG